MPSVEAEPLLNIQPYLFVFVLLTGPSPTALVQVPLMGKNNLLNSFNVLMLYMTLAFKDFHFPLTHIMRRGVKGMTEGQRVRIVGNHRVPGPFRGWQPPPQSTTLELAPRALTQRFLRDIGRLSRSAKLCRAHRYGSTPPCHACGSHGMYMSDLGCRPIYPEGGSSFEFILFEQYASACFSWCPPHHLWSVMPSGNWVEILAESLRPIMPWPRPEQRIKSRIVKNFISFICSHYRSFWSTAERVSALTCVM